MSKMKFSQKLLLFISAAILFIILSSSIYFFIKMRQAIYNDSYNLSASTLKQLNSNMNAKLDSITGTSNAIYTDYALMNSLYDSYQDPYEIFLFYRSLEKNLQALLSSDSYLNSISFYIGNKTLPFDKKYIYPIELLHNTDIYKKTIDRDGFLVYARLQELWPLISKEPLPEIRKNNICMFRLLNYTQAEEYYSILCIEIDYRQFLQFFKELTDERIFVFDEKQQIIISSEPEQIGKSLQDLDLDSNSESISEDKHPSLALKNGWQTILFQNNSHLLIKIRQMLWETILLGIALLLIAIPVVYIIISVFTKKLLYLSEIIKKVDEGNFDIPVEDKGQDEIGQVIKVFKQMLKRLQYLMHEVYEKEIANKSIELELLQAQINPHFLYNSLSSIVSLARIKQSDKLIQIVMNLSDFYRISLSKGEKCITLKKEIELTKHYASIMEMRYSDMVHITFETDGFLENGIVPKLIVQPFIENAILHGMYAEDGIQICVRTFLDEDMVTIQISDNGKGMTKEQISQVLSEQTGQSGYGIFNIQKRIKLSFGEAYGLRISSMPNRGTDVNVLLPYDGGVKR